MPAKIPALPVYPYWLRVNPSRHEALFVSTGVHQEDYPHFEFALVRGVVPMFQRFTGSVSGDYSGLAIAGHDGGPMTPHLYGGPPDNSMLPLTILGSSCKWPITARGRVHTGNPLCAYFPGVAPYLYCNSAKREASEEDGSKQPASGLKNDVIKSFKGLGVGVVLIPTGPFTVVLNLSVRDMLLGVGGVLQGMAIGLLVGKTWGLLVRRQNPWSWYSTHFADGAVWRYASDKLLRKAAQDIAVGFARTFEIGAPYRLAKLDFETGKVKVWTYEAGGFKLETNCPTAPLEQIVDAPASEPASVDSPEYWAEPTASGNPQQALLEDLLAGAPHAG